MARLPASLTASFLPFLVINAFVSSSPRCLISCIFHAFFSVYYLVERLQSTPANPAVESADRCPIMAPLYGALDNRRVDSCSRSLTSFVYCFPRDSERTCLALRPIRRRLYPLRPLFSLLLQEKLSSTPFGGGLSLPKRTAQRSIISCRLGRFAISLCTHFSESVFAL